MARHAAPAPVRLCWLPGAAMRAEDIAAQPWGAALAAHGFAADMDAIDLEPERLDGADAIDRCAGEVLRPAREAGQRVWLAGISLGGWQSVLCAARHPGLVDGLCLFSPYPGDRLAWRRIAQAGGLDAWTPEPHESDPALAVWAWWRRPPRSLRVWLGYGSADRFGDGMDRMAERLQGAPDRHAVHRIDADHDWACWHRLWGDFLHHGLAPWHARGPGASA
ncbi:alpha/beta hydrolase-fold protein [Hydrogenophaga crocea]|uniref:Esterase family protein n=1 Tax=Hydrogenophaga crocea TaxID=2716225 RepID=A0A6G8IH05_9BURK|nr:alpha/beta hydrolase-fold protein [Hydrogenophaga crocea]QIM52423.1 esterase family protein [Hydrogenophaga crocea]